MNSFRTCHSPRSPRRTQRLPSTQHTLDTTQVKMGNQLSAEDPGKNRKSLRTRSKNALGDSGEARRGEGVSQGDAESAQSLLGEVLESVLALGSQCSCVPKSTHAHPTSYDSANKRRGFPIVVAGSRPSLRSPGRLLNDSESLQIHSVGRSSSSALIADSEACNFDPLSALPAADSNLMAAGSSKSSSKASSQDTANAHCMHLSTRRKVCRSNGSARNHADMKFKRASSTTSMEPKKEDDRRKSNVNCGEKHEYDEDGFPRVCSETAARELSKVFKRLEKDRKASERKQAKKDAKALEEQRDFHLLQMSNRSKENHGLLPFD